MAILEHDEILKLHTAAISAHLSESRNALLAGVDSRFVARLQQERTPSDQMLRDLDMLNKAARLADGSVPLLTWIKNAASIGKSSREAAIFELALVRCDYAVALLEGVIVSEEPSEKRMTVEGDGKTDRCHPEAFAHGFDAFLSYNHDERATAYAVGRALTGRGLRIWLADWELTPGHPWQSDIENAIRKAKTAVILVGRSGIGPWGFPEMWSCIGEFVHRRMPVIPVLLPGVTSEPMLPLFLKQFTWVDLRAGVDEDGFGRLEWGITGVKPRKI